MPRPIQAERRYLAGLDGLRALAVLSVIAYHLGFGCAKGGMLGVGVFFTLSGYLITDLLLGHWRRHGGLGLGTFWLRRARRLLPALFLMLALVTVWVALFDVSQLDQVRRQVISAALYFANCAHYGAGAHGLGRSRSSRHRRLLVAANPTHRRAARAEVSTGPEISSGADDQQPRSVVAASPGCDGASVGFTGLESDRRTRGRRGVELDGQPSSSQRREPCLLCRPSIRRPAALAGDDARVPREQASAQQRSALLG